jgi:AraC family transcriptional regulator of adaptative response/methylated-DNA-[protein]-cysteine methyltransferase
MATVHFPIFAEPDHAALYAAFAARDPAYDGHVFACVETTGIFCRFTCPARKPKPENIRFHAGVAACLAQGFRPCLRCRPLEAVRNREPLVARLMDLLDAEPHRVWAEDDLVAMGLDPSTVRRAFKRHLGTTFLDLARMRRTGRGVEQIAGGSPVIDAQLTAGFDSGSGFREAVARLFGDAPADLKGQVLLRADWIETPIGAMLAVADRRELHLLEFFDRRALPTELKRLREATRSSITFGRLPPIDRIERELSAYFAGRSADFKTPFACHGSEFTRQVWGALRTIPLGTTKSYGEIAREIGRASACRAVARANGANQIAIVIPCHRVIGSDGSLTGYGGKLWRKQWLLRHERRMTTINAQASSAASSRS